MFRISSVFVAYAVSGVLVSGVAAAAIAASSQQPAMAPASPIVGGLTMLLGGIERNVVQAAELMPENLYSFRPTPEVRTFGQIIGHLVDSQRALCAGAEGGGVNLNDVVEKGTTGKTDLVKALRASFDGCRQVHAGITDATAAKLVPFGEGEVAATTILAFNVSHDNEHYGNLVTYMRLNGIVPPSSRPAR